MKLEKWAAISEIASGIAIVLTLIALITQIRDNTDAIRAATRESVAERVERLTLTVAASPGLAAVVEKTGLPLIASDTLSRSEALQLQAFINSVLRNTEEAFLQTKEGRLGDAYFEGRLRGTVNVVRSGLGAEAYGLLKEQGQYDKAFTDRVDQAIAELGQADGDGGH